LPSLEGTPWCLVGHGHPIVTLLAAAGGSLSNVRELRNVIERAVELDADERQRILEALDA
jgi:hypothetical protein